MMTSIRKIALFGSAFTTAPSPVAERLRAWLEAHHIETVVAPKQPIDADLVISMGGDGTFLQTAHAVAAQQLPILGVNTGRLGFLAEISPAEMEATLEEIVAGNFKVEERCVLQLAYSEGTPTLYPYGLNEIAVMKQDVSSMISIRVEINGEYLTTYQADGLIINTPTGSTGYALSVGGPVIQPESHVLGIIPVAPHSLTARPVTLMDDVEIVLKVSSRNHRFLVAVDGRSETCSEDITLTIRKAPYHVRVVKRPSSSFFHTLRTKLMWGTDPRENS